MNEAIITVAVVMLVFAAGVLAVHHFTQKHQNRRHKPRAH